MKFVVMESCKDSFTCYLAHPASVIEAVSAEEARDKVLREKEGYFQPDRLRHFKLHSITIHQIGASDEVDFAKFVDDWSAKKQQEDQEAHEEKERSEFQRLSEKFMRNCWQPPQS